MDPDHNYRMYMIGDDGHVFGRLDLVSVDDEAAMAQAKQMMDGHACELWDGARKIAVFEPEK